MTRGPSKKDIDLGILRQVVEEEGLAGVEKIKDRYNEEADNSLSWGTCRDRLRDNKGFVQVEAGGFDFWKVK